MNDELTPGLKEVQRIAALLGKTEREYAASSLRYETKIEKLKERLDEVIVTVADWEKTSHRAIARAANRKSGATVRDARRRVEKRRKRSDSIGE